MNIGLVVPPADSDGESPLPDAVVQLHAKDQVGLARTNLPAGLKLIPQDRRAPIVLRQLIPAGHKVALQEIAAGQPVYRYGQFIGVASQAILPGEHVHLHNLSLQGLDRTHHFGASLKPVNLVPEAERGSFSGYLRPDGRIGTRNIVAVISTVNCSAHVTQEIARAFTAERLAALPNVDGVVAFTHQSGCSIRSNGPEYVWLQRTLAGIATHPNVGAYLLVGLGCEVNQLTELIGNFGLAGESAPPALAIQDLGGIRKTVLAGVAAIDEMLPAVNAVRRTPQPLAGLTLALQCGGSDGWSGVTANPLVGLVADAVVRQGGTVLLGETPEIYGAEHLLTGRAASAEVGQKLLDQVRWWEDHARRQGTQIDNNPTPGNKIGGLTTIYEKALGAVAKGGSTPLTGVYDYAERVTARGLTFMNTPGNDPTAVTGQIAGGCNLVLFTTGRGSVFGSTPAPTIKIASNSATYQQMIDDMDFDAGRILAGETMETVASELLDLVVAVASGQASKSEAQGVGEREFSPWRYGETV